MSRLPADYRDNRVCIFGMGYVGLTLATVMADVGFDVLGLEIRDDIVDALSQGTSHFHEPGLENQMRKLVADGRLRFARELGDDEASVYIITVGTPMGSDGRVHLDSIRNVASALAGRLKAGDLVVMRSTVRLGATREIVVPILDRAGVPYDIVFCPERTLEGQAMPELRYLPQIVGGVSLEARARAAQLFSFVTPTVVQVASLETAEMIKLIDNSQRDVQFAFANEIARMCDAVGISAADVIQAGKLGYPRTNLPMPGPVGGPCLEKDSYILAEGLEPHGIEPEITLAARRVNERQPAETVATIQRWFAESVPPLPARPTIALAGLAFKGRPATDDLRGTTAQPILKALRTAFPGATFRGYDAVVPAAEIAQAFDIEPVESVAAALDGAHLLVIANSHLEFERLALDALAAAMARPGLVFDFWNNFAAAELSMPDGTAYMALGASTLTPPLNAAARGAA